MTENIFSIKYPRTVIRGFLSCFYLLHDINFLCHRQIYHFERAITFTTRTRTRTYSIYYLLYDQRMKPMTICQYLGFVSISDCHNLGFFKINFDHVMNLTCNIT